MCRFCSPERSYKGLRGAGSKERAPPGGREGEIRWRECEDFAPRNGATRVSGERGAKRKSHRAPGRFKSGGGNVKILLPGTELQGLAGSGEQREGARRATERAKSGGGNVKILLPETELQGLVGRGEQREAAGCPAGHTPGLAQEYVQEKTCIFIHKHVLSYQCH